MRAGRRFGMILHREDRLVRVAQAFDRAVVQVQVRDVRVGRQRVGIDREAVVLRRDLDLARSRGTSPGDSRRGGRISACRCGRPSRGRAPGARGRCRTSARRCRAALSTLSMAYGTAAGSPGPLLRNTPSGSMASRSAAGADAGNTVTSQLCCGEPAQDVLLDAEIVGRDPQALRGAPLRRHAELAGLLERRRAPFVRRLARDGLHEIGALHAAGCCAHAARAPPGRPARSRSRRA